MQQELKKLQGGWEASRGGGGSDLFEAARYYYLRFTHDSINREENQLDPFFISVREAMPGTLYMLSTYLLCEWQLEL